MTTLRYLADVRMPTEKAHGWQIVQMCGAFAGAGVAVELSTPKRRQPDRSLTGRSLFEYYGVSRSFSHRLVADVDLVGLEERLPSALESSLHQGHSYVWARYAVGLEGHRARPDLLYTRDLGIATRAIGADLPVVWEVHAFPGERGRRMIGTALRRRRPRAIVALTPFLRDGLVTAGFRDDEVIVESDAIAPDRYEDLPDREQARMSLGLPAGPLVGFVGRFQAMEAERGLIDLIRAVAAVPGGSAPTLVLLGGPMEAAPRYHDEAARVGLPEGRLRIVDRISSAQVPMWLRALDVGVMPYPDTRHYSLELSPLKMFEYMAAGLPIVASDLPSLRLHLRDGENALLVTAGDTSALAGAIARLVGNPALAARLAARAKADVSSLTWDARARRILTAAGVTP